MPLTQDYLRFCQRKPIRGLETVQRWPLSAPKTRHFKCASETDRKEVYFLRTRHLHSQRLACSHDTICLTSGLQARGEEGHACSLKNSGEPGDTARKPVMYLSEPISTQQESSRSVVKRGGWRRWGHREEDYIIHNMHIIQYYICKCVYIYFSIISFPFRGSDFKAVNNVQLAEICIPITLGDRLRSIDSWRLKECW